MPVKLFITGTDTGVGKTYVSVRLLDKFKREGYSTIGLKPVASGAIWQDGKLINDDALQLNQASTITLDYSQTNPIVFEEAIAPHIAAANNNVKIELEEVVNHVNAIFDHSADIYIVEGAGGWYVPLNEKETLADLAISLNLGVILVVGIRLGCINHAILTAEAIRRSNLELVGWVANCLEPLQESDSIIQTLKAWLPEPCLEVVPYS